MTNIVQVFRIAALGLSLAVATGAHAQKAYPSPEAAADALVDAIARSDRDALQATLGADYRKYLPVGTVDGEDVFRFLQAWSQSHAIVAEGSDQARLSVGRDGWTLPLPIVKTTNGWRFDTRQAPRELGIRRIGRNELAAIQVVLAYTDAQEEYKAKDWDGDGVKAYAMRALSSPGKRDGLYWAAAPGAPESPLGPAFADAQRGEPYHGYRYRILTAQGKDAPGGARSYLKGGRMTEGFALIAWPAKYADTGVMTFIVNQDGVVHQKDLGSATDAVARRITAYNPDAGWSKVSPEK